jgi:hypothetical protein
VDPDRYVADDVRVTNAVPSHPLARPARATPVAASGPELLLVATVGAASLSLRIVLDALARATRHQPPSTDAVTRLAFTGLAIGLATGRSVARTLGTALDAVGRAASGTMESMPSIMRDPVEERMAQWRDAERARSRALGEAELLVEDVVAALVPRIVSATLDQLDLTSIVADRVDLNAIVQRVDLNAVASRIDVNAIAANLDLEALVAKIDLDSIAQTVIDEIDLPEIIRRSTGSVASETVRGVRMQSIDADQALAGLVDRVLRRRRPRRLDVPAVPEVETPSEEGAAT